MPNEWLACPPVLLGTADGSVAARKMAKDTGGRLRHHHGSTGASALPSKQNANLAIHVPWNSWETRVCSLCDKGRRRYEISRSLISSI